MQYQRKREGKKLWEIVLETVGEFFAHIEVNVFAAHVSEIKDGDKVVSTLREATRKGKTQPVRKTIEINLNDRIAKDR